MNKGKKIEVNLSSLVELKAELFRKEEEAKRNLGAKDPSNASLKLTGKLKAELEAHDRRHKGTFNRGTKSREETKPSPIDEENEEVKKALEASRKKLEEKAKLYERLVSNSQFNDEDELYMVDFNRKILNQNYKKCSVANAPEDIIVEDEESYKPKDDTEEWIEYTDSFGRSRKCLKKDLSKMQAMDLELQRKNAVPPPGFDSEVDKNVNQHSESKMEAPPFHDGPLHYQNVQHNEIRNHGVGYYGFSVDEEARSKQMEQLETLRKQTVDGRTLREKMKEQRKAALKDRLKKVKQRKLMKSGESMPLTESESSDDEDFINEAKTELPQEVKPDANKEAERASTVRPWDRGKAGVRITQPFQKDSQKNWVEQRRTERPSEFAPPQFYNERDKRVESMHQFFKEAQMAQALSNPENIPLP